MDQSITLATGAKMPLLGFGTWNAKPGEVEQAVRVALDVGYRHIDTASVYGNEHEIGKAIADSFKARTLKRQDLFVTGKLWIDDFDPEHVEPALRQTLKKLQLDYLDMYLVHLPTGMKKGTMEPSNFSLLDNWKAMEAVYAKGLTKAIGVSNYNAEQVERIAKNCSVAPHNNQVECHPWWPQLELQQENAKHGCHLSAYGPIGSPGRLDVKFPGVEWSDPGILLEDASVVAIAKKHGKTPAQVLLRYLIQRGLPVLPKSVNPGRIKQNSQVFDFALTDDEISELNSLKVRHRLFAQNYTEVHPEFPFREDAK